MQWFFSIHGAAAAALAITLSLSEPVAVSAAVEVGQDDVHRIAVTITLPPRRTRRVNVWCLRRTAGTLTRQGGALRFSSWRDELAALRRQGAGGSRVSRARQLMQRGDAACAASGRVLRTPRPDPTPRPPPRPTVAAGFFTIDGCLTERGKSRFGVPTGVSGACVTQGAALWSSRCSGCHGEKNNRTYSTVERMTRLPPMSFALSRDELADLTAFSNRFERE